MNEIKLGVKAKDVVTGLSGIVMARAEYLSGSIKYELQPVSDSPSDKVKESHWVDSAFVQFVDTGVHVAPSEREIGFKLGI